MYEPLTEAIKQIEEKPQINTAGIVQVLEGIVKPNGKDPVDIVGLDGMPEVYQNVRAFYDQGVEALESGSTFYNQVGALQTLRAIRQKHY